MNWRWYCLIVSLTALCASAPVPESAPVPAPVPQASAPEPAPRAPVPAPVPQASAPVPVPPVPAPVPVSGPPPAPVPVPVAMPPPVPVPSSGGPSPPPPSNGGYVAPVAPKAAPVAPVPVIRTATPTPTPRGPVAPIYDVRNAALYIKMTANASVAHAFVGNPEGIDVANVIGRIWQYNSGVAEADRGAVGTQVERKVLRIEWLYPSTIMLSCRPEDWEPKYVAETICANMYQHMLSDTFDPNCPGFEEAPIWFRCTDIHLAILYATTKLHIKVDLLDIVLLRPPTHPSYPASYDLVKDVLPVAPLALSLEPVNVTFSMWLPSGTVTYVIGELGMILREKTRVPEALLGQRPLQLTPDGRDLVVVDAARSSRGLSYEVVAGSKWLLVNVTINGDVFNPINPPDSRDLATFFTAVLQSDYYKESDTILFKLAHAIFDDEPPTTDPAGTITYVPLAPQPTPLAVGGGGGGFPMWLIVLIVIAFVVVLVGIVVLALIFCYQQRSKTSPQEEDDDDEDFVGELLTTIFVRACGDWAEETEKELAVEILSDMTVRNVVNKCLKYFDLTRPAFLFSVEGAHVQSDNVLHTFPANTLLFCGKKFIKFDDGDEPTSPPPASVGNVDVDV